MAPTIRVQSHALVLVTDRHDLAIKAVSENAEEFCGYAPDALRQMSLSDLFHESVIGEMREFINEEFPSVLKIAEPAGWPRGEYQVIFRTVGEDLVVEIEPRRSWPHSGDYSARLNDFTHELENNVTIDDLLQQLCDGLTFHFGYDRAIVIQFDEQNDGIVTHEARCEDMDSLLDVRFVEEDFPALTRHNQLANTVMNYTAVEEPLVPVTGDISESSWETLRRQIAAREPNVNSHRYLRDSALRTLGHLSLIVDGKLWGSVYMHSRDARYIDYQMRSFLRIVGRVAQQKIGFHIFHQSLRLSQEANGIRDKLYECIVAADSLVGGLTEGRINLLDLIEGTRGAAICSDDNMTLYGTTPSEELVNAVVKWMKQEIGDEQIWHTDNLTAHYAPVGDYVDKAAGMLYLPLDPKANQWVIWFKPEVVQKISFGSHRAASGQREYRVNEQVCYNCCLPWRNDVVGTAQELQSFVQKTVLERYTSTRRHNTLLQEAIEDLEVFSYTIGHDLRAPLRGISSYAEILLEDFGQRLGSEGKAHLRVIQKNALRMRTFMDDLLALSRIERSRMLINRLSVPKLVTRVLDDLSTSGEGTPSCTVQEGLPPICGDQNHLVIVFTNLLSNAFKYSAQEAEARVEVGFTGEYREGSPVFYVSDNGIGIPESQQSRMFELFSRSTNSGEFDGTGIGLALVQRIIRFHDGEVWIDSKVGEGTRILFYTGVEVGD